MNLRTTSLLLTTTALAGATWSAQDPGDRTPPARGSIGSPAQEFVLQGRHGESIQFPDRSSGQTRLTVLVFWASWNDPSERQLARLATLWPRWEAHGVRLVAVNVESTRHTPEELAAIDAWLEQTPLPVPVAIDHGLRAFHAYGVVAVPTTVVVDAGGSIVHRMPGYPIAGSEDFIDFVEERVVEQSGPSRTRADSRTPERQRALRHTRLARLLRQRDQVELAEYSLRRAIAEDERLLEARLGLAALLESTQRVEGAREQLELATRFFPDDALLDTARADFELRHGALEVAEQLARRAISRNPSLSEPRLVLARALRANDDIQAARAQLSEAVAANPLSVPAHIELGLLHETAGDEKGAYEWYARAFDLLRPDWRP